MWWLLLVFGNDIFFSNWFFWKWTQLGFDKFMRCQLLSAFIRLLLGNKLFMDCSFKSNYWLLGEQASLDFTIYPHLLISFCLCSQVVGIVANQRSSPTKNLVLPSSLGFVIGFPSIHFLQSQMVWKIWIYTPVLRGW